jgi:hypothetical protein
MFIAALFTIAKLWKQPRCPKTDEWMKEMWYFYTMEYYLAIKKNEIILFPGKWGGTGDCHVVMLSEVRLRRTKVTCFPSHVEARPTR